MQSGHIEIQIKEKKRGKTEPYRNGWLIKSLYRLSEEKLIWWWVGSWPFLLLKEFSKSFSVLVSCILFLSPPLVFFTLSEIYFFSSAFDGRLRLSWTMQSLITGTRSEQRCRERKGREEKKVNHSARRRI